MNASKKTYFKIQSSIVGLAAKGIFFVLHLEDEDPRDTLDSFLLGEPRNCGGPFTTSEEAARAGTAALNKVMSALHQVDGVTAQRPGRA